MADNLQISILSTPTEVKVLSSSEYSKLCCLKRHCSSEEETSCSHEALKVASKQQVNFNHASSELYTPHRIVELNTSLEQPWTWNKEQKRFYTFTSRLHGCSFMDWAHLVCSQCGNIVREKAFHLSCLSPYCKNPECIKNRIRITKAAMQSYRIRTKRLYHFTLGFAPVKELTNPHRLSCDLIAKKFIKRIKTLFPDVYLIMVRDINLSKEGFRVHYHVAGFNIKDFRNFSYNLLREGKNLSECLKMRVAVSLAGYQNKNTIFTYFSKRVAGVFGHTSKGDDFYYSDFMSEKDYFKVFYNKRKIWFFLNNLVPSGTEFIRLISHSIENCPYCGSSHFRLSPVNSFQPPPDLFCHSCGIFVDARDWNYQEGVCKMCDKKHTLQRKHEAFVREFQNFLDGKREPLLENEQLSLY